MATASITNVDVALIATRNGNRVRIDGNGGANLPIDSGAHRFTFTLQDNSGLNVRFSSLDTEDGGTCPPDPGENSGQIVGVVMNNNRTPKTAAFTDNNNNKAKDGPLNVCYQWNFTCDAGAEVDSFDPIITNGGETRA